MGKIIPENLCDGVFHQLKKVVSFAFGQFKSNGILELFALSPDWEQDFKAKFEELYQEMHNKMEGEESKGGDVHKVVAVACLAVLLSRPFKSEPYKEGQSANEYIAYGLALQLLREDQLARFPEDIREELRNKTLPFPTPNSMHLGSQSVIDSTLIAFRHLSRAITACLPIDIEPLLALHFFYVDVHSYQAMEEISTKVS